MVALTPYTAFLLMGVIWAVLSSFDKWSTIDHDPFVELPRRRGMDQNSWIWLVMLAAIAFPFAHSIRGIAFLMIVALGAYQGSKVILEPIVAHWGVRRQKALIRRWEQTQPKS